VLSSVSAVLHYIRRTHFQIQSVLPREQPTKIINQFIHHERVSHREKRADDHCHDKEGLSQSPTHTKAMYRVGFALQIQGKKIILLKLKF